MDGQRRFAVIGTDARLAAAGRALAFVGHQRPHAAARKHRPQQHSAGQQQVCHARSRQPGNGNAQRAQRGQRSMQATFER